MNKTAEKYSLKTAWLPREEHDTEQTKREYEGNKKYIECIASNRERLTCVRIDIASSGAVTGDLVSKSVSQTRIDNISEKCPIPSD